MHTREAGKTVTFTHQRLRVWHETVALVRWVHGHPIGNAELRDQASRASLSVGCNVAEGAALDGASRRRHLKIARASLVEVVAAYELAAAIGERIHVDELFPRADAVYAMLTGLARSSATSLMVTDTSPSSGFGSCPRERDGSSEP